MNKTIVYETVTAPFPTNQKKVINLNLKFKINKFPEIIPILLFRLI